MKKATGTLGANFQIIIDGLIKEKLESVEKGNNIHERARAEFQFVRERLLEQYQANIQHYADHCTQFREFHGLRPFTWENETIDRVKGAINGAPFPVMRKILAGKKNQSLKAVGKTMAASQKLKPEYQGENHPLYLAPSIGPYKSKSKQALDAEQQFDSTGKITVPEPQAKIAYKNTLSEWDWREYERRQKLRAEGKPAEVVNNIHREAEYDVQLDPDCPTIKKKIFHREDRDALVDEVVTRTKNTSGYSPQFPYGAEVDQPNSAVESYQAYLSSVGRI